jgi:hypothetical protein
MPAKAGTQRPPAPCETALGSRLRGNDKKIVGAYGEAIYSAASFSGCAFAIQPPPSTRVPGRS